MAQGKITVSNFSEQTMNVYIIAPSTGALVASGALASAQTSGFLVSGYGEYRVDFSAATGGVAATNVTAPGVVQIEITGG